MEWRGREWVEGNIRDQVGGLEGETEEESDEKEILIFLLMAHCGF